MNPYYIPDVKPSGNIRTQISNPLAPMDGDWTMKKDGVDLSGYAGAITQGAGGLLSMTSDWTSMAKQGLGLEGRETPSTAGYSGDFFNRAQAAQVQKLSASEIFGGAAKGAVSGAGAGPAGALIGAGVGTLGTIFASNRRRRRQEYERDQALSQALSYQKDYNQAETYRDQQQTSAADYRRRLDNYNQNLYSWSGI